MSRRVIIIGPTSAAAVAIERSLKARGANVVVADDARHALLLLRIFSPEVLIAPRPLSPDELAVLLSSSSRPLVIVDDLDEGTAMELIRQGIARVVPRRSGTDVLGAVVDAPLGTERPVPRALAQLGLLKSTGTLLVGTPPAGEIVVDAGRVHGASVAGLGRPEALRMLLTLDGPQSVQFVPAEALSLDIEEGPSLEAIGIDDDDIETIGSIPRAPATGEELAALPPPTALVVEDDVDLSRLYALVLKTKGFSAVIASDGVEGFEKACALMPDVIITDIMMPRETGWDLLARIRNSARLRELRVILLSHHAEMVTRLKSANTGADGYLQKTARPDAIVSAVVASITPRRDLEAVFLARAPRVDGDIAVIGSQTLLRLLARHEVSGRVAIRAGTTRYLVSFQQGDIVDAQCSVGASTLHHRDALRSLLLLDDGLFTFVAGNPPATAPRTPLAPLLDGLCDELEEWLESSRSDVLAKEVALQTRADLLEVYLTTCPDGARAVVEQIANGVSPRGIIMAGTADPVVVDTVVRDLFRKGVVQPGLSPT